MIPIAVPSHSSGGVGDKLQMLRVSLFRPLAVLEAVYQQAALLTRIYLGSVALMGLAIGLGELITLSEERQIPRGPDPVLFFMSERSAVAAGAVLLLGTAIAAASPGNLEKRLAVVLISGVFLGAYQLTRLFFGVEEPCRCLMGLASVAKLGTTLTTVLKYAVITALVVPSAGLIRWNRRTMLKAS